MAVSVKRRLGSALGLCLSVGCYSGVSHDPGNAEGTDDGQDGGGSDEGGSDDGDNDGPFACNPDATVDSVSLRRLSKAQYDNTIRDLLTWAVGDSGEQIHADVSSLIEHMPEDARRSVPNEVRGGFRRLDQDVHQEHINAGYDVAVDVAARLTTAHLGTIAGACATDGDVGNDDTCIDQFIATFGERALRRPLTDDELGFYRDVFDADGVTEGTEPEAFADVIVVMLTSPQFMYMVEDDSIPDTAEPGLYPLNDFELAQRLSYHFWQTSPDDALIEAARAGELQTDEGYQAQVDRLFNDSRTGAALDEFFGEWLWLEDLPALDARLGAPVYDAFVDGLEITPESTDNMREEVLAMASYYALDTEASFADFFMSTESFATTPDLAEIYGVEPWTGGDPPTFPDAERVGLISRAALVATGSPTTRPIMKGVFIRKALLCQGLPPPPDNAAATPPEATEEATTREIVEGLTEQPGTQCAGCHATLINPLGYATENFDALGRFRSEQTLFDEDGNVTGSRAVDTTSVPGIPAGDERVSAGAGDLSQMLLESESVHACFARHYLRWTFGRVENVQADGCMLNAVTSNLVDEAPLNDVLRQLALRDEFRTRRIEE